MRTLNSFLTHYWPIHDTSCHFFLKMSVPNRPNLTKHDLKHSWNSCFTIFVWFTIFMKYGKKNMNHAKHFMNHGFKNMNLFVQNMNWVWTSLTKIWTMYELSWMKCELNLWQIFFGIHQSENVTRICYYGTI